MTNTVSGFHRVFSSLTFNSHSFLISGIKLFLLFLCSGLSPVNLIDLKSWREEGGEDRKRRERWRKSRVVEEEDDTELSCWQMCWAHPCSALMRGHEKMEGRSMKSLEVSNEKIKKCAEEEGRRKRHWGPVPSVFSFLCFDLSFGQVKQKSLFKFR